MSLVVGTNCGFVTVAPTNDPATGDTAVLCNVSAFDRSYGFKVTSPAGNWKLTEIGVWLDNAENETNWEAALYSHDAVNDLPEDLLVSNLTNAKGTSGSVWISSALTPYALTPSTTYWICVQFDAHGGSGAQYTLEDTVSHTGERAVRENGDTTLPNPWDDASIEDDNTAIAFYGLYQSSGPAMKINIGDVWKTVDGVQINIGDAWKVVDAAQINIGDSWKDSE